MSDQLRDDIQERIQQHDAGGFCDCAEIRLLRRCATALDQHAATIDRLESVVLPHIDAMEKANVLCPEDWRYLRQLVAAEPRTRTLSADEFEELSLMGATKDGTLRLGAEAATRLLKHARALADLTGLGDVRALLVLNSELEKLRRDLGR